MPNDVVRRKLESLRRCIQRIAIAAQMIGPQGVDRDQDAIGAGAGLEVAPVCGTVSRTDRSRRSGTANRRTGPKIQRGPGTRKQEAASKGPGKAAGSEQRGPRRCAREQPGNQSRGLVLMSLRPRQRNRRNAIACGTSKTLSVRVRSPRARGRSRAGSSIGSSSAPSGVGVL